MLPGWDEIPGARGCTPQSCGFRDHAAELAALGARVAGVSAQTLDDQLEFAERNRMPFPVIADPELRLRDVLGLPTFHVEGLELYKRLAFVAEHGRIVKVFYPVFPPDRNAQDVAGLAQRLTEPSSRERPERVVRHLPRVAVRDRRRPPSNRPRTCPRPRARCGRRPAGPRRARRRPRPASGRCRRASRRPSRPRRRPRCPRPGCSRLQSATIMPPAWKKTTSSGPLDAVQPSAS